MPKVSLPFYRNGEPFDPRVSLKDLEDYEVAEQEALKGPALGVLRLRTQFIVKCIERDAKGPVDLKATAAEIHDAVHTIWWTQALGAEQVPLGSSGETSTSERPAASTLRSDSPASPTPEASAPTRPAS